MTGDPVFTIFMFFPMTGCPYPTRVRRSCPVSAGIHITTAIGFPLFRNPDMIRTRCDRPYDNGRDRTDLARRKYIYPSFISYPVWWKSSSSNSSVFSFFPSSLFSPPPLFFFSPPALLKLISGWGLFLFFSFAFFFFI